MIYWNYARLIKCIGGLLGLPILWLNLFIATKIPFMKKIAERRTKEAGFSTVEEWCKNSYNIANEIDFYDFWFCELLLVIHYLFFSLGTMNFLLGGVLGYDVFKILLWGDLENNKLVFAISLLVLSVGVKYALAHSIDKEKEYLTAFEKMGKIDRLKSALFSIVATLFVTLYFIFSFKHFRG